MTVKAWSQSSDPSSSERGTARDPRRYPVPGDVFAKPNGETRLIKQSSLPVTALLGYVMYTVGDDPTERRILVRSFRLWARDAIIKVQQ